MSAAWFNMNGMSWKTAADFRYVLYLFGLGTIINVGVAVFSLGLNKKVNAGKYRVCICG